MPPRTTIDPQNTNITTKLAGLWSAAVTLVAAAVWVTVLVYDIRSDIRTLKAEIWTRNQHERFAYQLHNDNRGVNLVVREPDGSPIGRMP